MYSNLEGEGVELFLDLVVQDVSIRSFDGNVDIILATSDNLES